MKTIRERPCQRRHHRLTAPLYVIFEDAEPLQAEDWSIGGLGVKLTTVENIPALGDKVPFALVLSFQGYDIRFDVTGEVMRRDEDNHFIGVQFYELSERSEDLLTYFSEDLIRGHMGTVEDSICRIDVPVTPISTKPTTSHVSETPVKRLPVKTIVMSTIYIVVGLMVFGYLGLLGYSNVMRLEVATSVVSTELQTLKMPVDGIIRPVKFEVGARFNAGDEILKIDDLKLQSQISAAQLKVEAAQKALWRTQQQHRIETERMKLYRIVNKTDKNIADARLSSLRSALKAADAHYLRLKKLKKSGAVTLYKYEEARQSQARAAAAVREAELVVEKNTAMEVASDRRHYNHKEFVTDLDMLSLDLEMAYSTLELEMRKLSQLEKMKEQLVIRAPFDGRIVNLYQAANSNVVRNDPIFLIERADDISVTAFLNQSEILEVGLYDQAKVFVPALDRHFPAVVSKIDRSSLFLNKNASGYTWRDGKERTAAVTLKLSAGNDLSAYITAGLPVVVIFDRRGTSDIWSSIKGIVGGQSDNIVIKPGAEDEAI